MYSVFPTGQVTLADRYYYFTGGEQRHGEFKQIPQGSGGPGI